MKNYLNALIFAFIGIIFFSSCNTTSGVKSKDDGITNDVFYQDLADRLRAEGLGVQGTGTSVSIVIRGIQTIMGDTRPIFVVNGYNMGRDYNSVNNAINVNDIRNVKVLKSKSETALYGEDGNNGVIILTMKK